MSTYTGDVVFVDGIHYPATAVDADGEPDENGNQPVHADLTRPLRWDDGGYRDAKSDEPLHAETYHERDAAIDTVLVPAQAGRAVYPVGVHVHSDDGETYFLIDENDQAHRDHPLAWDPDMQAFRAKEAS